MASQKLGNPATDAAIALARRDLMRLSPRKPETIASSWCALVRSDARTFAPLDAVDEKVRSTLQGDQPYRHRVCVGGVSVCVCKVHPSVSETLRPLLQVVSAAFFSTPSPILLDEICFHDRRRTLVDQFSCHITNGQSEKVAGPPYGM